MHSYFACKLFVTKTVLFRVVNLLDLFPNWKLWNQYNGFIQCNFIKVRLLLFIRVFVRLLVCLFVCIFLCLFVCLMCMCVCVRERERKKKRERERDYAWPPSSCQAELLPLHTLIISHMKQCTDLYPFSLQQRTISKVGVECLQNIKTCLWDY